MEGLLGLTNNIRTTESAVRDLSVLERMEGRVQQDRDKEVNAQKEQALMYERAYQFADQLLEKDRNRINARVKMAQRQIGEHMAESGGSKSRFMEQGGLGIINNITNDIMRSDEAVQYQENKKNLAKIWEAQEKGLGHLISPNDLKSLEDYENNPNGGPISYSGMMAQIEIPPANQTDYGTAISPEKVMSYNSNMVKIMSNFKTVHPEKEPNHANIVAFMKEMGYGGMGNNTARMREEALLKAAYARNKKNSPTNPDKIANSALGQINALRADMPKGISVQDINSKYGGNLVETLKKSNSAYAKLLGDKFKPMSRQRLLSEEGFDWQDARGALGVRNKDESIVEYLFNEKVGLSEAYEILPHNKFQIANATFEEQYEIKDGHILNFTPSEDMYRMDGVQLTGKNKLDPDDHTGKYKVLGVTTALRTNPASDGDADALVINAYNDDGSIDEKATKDVHEGYGDSETQMAIAIAMQNENGDIFYKKIDIEKPQIKTVFSNAMGDDDDITDTVNQDNQIAQQKAFYENMDKEEELRVRSTIKTMNQKVYQDPVFEQEGKKYWGANGAGSLNRSKMMRSFYSALDFVRNSGVRNNDFPNGDTNIYPDQVQKAIDNNMFTAYMATGTVEDDLRNYDQGNTEAAIIGKWLRNMNAQYEEGGADQGFHNELSQKWMQLLSFEK